MQTKLFRRGFFFSFAMPQDNNSVVHPTKKGESPKTGIDSNRSREERGYKN
jgi:hypothetical protein